MNTVFNLILCFIKYQKGLNRTFLKNLILLVCYSGNVRNKRVVYVLRVQINLHYKAISLIYVMICYLEEVSILDMF